MWGQLVHVASSYPAAWRIQSLRAPTRRVLLLLGARARAGVYFPPPPRTTNTLNTIIMRGTWRRTHDAPGVSPARAVSPACLAVSGEVHVHVTRMKGRGQYNSLHGVESAAASTFK